MSLYNNILIAFDGSSDSVRALKAAEALATHLQSRVTVAYVHDKPLNKTVTPETQVADTLFTRDPSLLATQTYAGPVTQNPSDSLENYQPLTVQDEEPNHILNQANKIFSDDIDVKYEKLHGDPADELQGYIRENEMDLIVIGNRGMSGVKRLVMGSVSEKIAKHANCPVLVVK